jgi:hypothetical protein
MKGYDAAATTTNAASNIHKSRQPTVAILSPKPAKQRRPAHNVCLAFADELMARDSASLIVGKHEFETNETTKRYARTNGENSREGSRLGAYDDVVMMSGRSQHVNSGEPRVYIVENSSQEDDLDAG